MRFRPTALLAVLALMATVAAACGNSTTSSADANGSRDDATPTTAAGSPGSSSRTGSSGTSAPADLTKNVPVTAPGVTDKEIHVGGVVSKTNPLGGEYDQAFFGVEAYFDMVNEHGGIYGRQLKLTVKRDDQLAKNLEETQALISQDEVFAVMPVANIAAFTGSQLLADAGVPTFGWNVNAEWTGPKNLFGEKGSFLCFTCPRPDLPFIAKQLGRTKVGVLAYTVAQSHDCGIGVEESMKKWASPPIYSDLAVPFSFTPDFSVQVSKMKEAGVDFIATCMDDNGVVGVAKEMKKVGMTAPLFLPNGYNGDLVAKFGDLLEGSIVAIGTAPFESVDPPAALEEYERRIAKVGGKKGELSLVGWMNADLFVRGLQAAGPEFSRAKVIDGINAITDWDADGIGPGIDWTQSHERNSGDFCSAYAKIQQSTFVPQWAEPGKPFVCFDRTAATLPDKPRVRA